MKCMRYIQRTMYDKNCINPIFKRYRLVLISLGINECYGLFFVSKFLIIEWSEILAI